MRFRAIAVALGASALVLTSLSASAITFGHFDGNRHPNVGGLVAEWREEGQKDLLCSGTLIDERVFLTAAHCTEYLRSIDIAPDEVWVTFDPTFDQDSELIAGTYTSHPGYNQRQSDPKDIAVVELEEDGGATPATLPTANQLGKSNLRGEWFTAVGYGTVRENKKKGPHALKSNDNRYYATQEFTALTKTWLKLSMNPSTGSGGTCYGDSGGPHFLRDTNVIVSTTITGDAQCRATDVTYRLDTASARNFLDDFVTLP
ncbi:MAG: trypsin-like serine protease [Actinomycetota bacterium]|nr:trypsin-like serine protease [Actinomycetota bacterium]